MTTVRAAAVVVDPRDHVEKDLVGQRAQRARSAASRVEAARGDARLRAIVGMWYVASSRAMKAEHRYRVLTVPPEAKRAAELLALARRQAVGATSSIEVSTLRPPAQRVP